MNERSFVRAARTVTPVDMAAAQAALMLHSQLTKPAEIGRASCRERVCLAV